MTLQITFNPADLDETCGALSVAAHVRGTTLEELLAAVAGGITPEASEEVLRHRCAQMLDPGNYGETRRGLVRIVAEASPAEVSKDVLYAAATAIPENAGKNAGQVVGGLHGNLEQSWRALGGSGTFVMNSGTGFRMRPELAAVVLDVLDTH